MKFIKGYKTYIVATLMSMVALVHLLSGETTLVEFVTDPYFILLLEGLGLAALRHGME